MDIKLQITSLALYLSIVVGGFALIPKGPPLFGMGMVPGTLVVLSRFGLPLILSMGMSFAVYRRSRVRRGIQAGFFFAGFLSSSGGWPFFFFVRK
jgi:hypothetical protein